KDRFPFLLVFRMYMGPRDAMIYPLRRPCLYIKYFLVEKKISREEKVGSFFPCQVVYCLASQKLLLFYPPSPFPLASITNPPCSIWVQNHRAMCRCLVAMLP